MKTTPKSLRLKNKGDKTAYSVSLTGEQISLIRSLYMRLEKLWVRNDVESYLGSNGIVERRIVYECWFCHRGSLENASSIQHRQDCIVALSNAEWEQMNAQFIKALDGGEENGSPA